MEHLLPSSTPVSSIALERERSVCPTDELTRLLYSGSAEYEKRVKIQKLIENNKVFAKNPHFMSRTQIMKSGMKKLYYFKSFLKEHNISHPNDVAIVWDSIDEQLPNGLHLSMYLPTIQALGSLEQRKKWGDLTSDQRIIGTYVQTELGHGSFVRGIETRAVFDENTDEFVLDTPSIESTKWWAGNLGKTANHCVLMARCISNNTDHGVHAFVVQLRDLETHTPVKGVEIGDIGPKFGYDMNDNGFLRLESVRIPRGNLLCKYVTVDVTGAYHKSSHSKMQYQTMVLMRSGLVTSSFKQLARAVTISVRYSAVRRQFPGESDTERQILDYTTQQLKLFPYLASAYAFHFVGKSLLCMYYENVQRLERNDTSFLGDIHITSCALKAFATVTAVEGIEVCRKAMGGHGYSKFSGCMWARAFPPYCTVVDVYANFLPAQTYEGESTVLLLQVARFLLKSYQKIRAGKTVSPSLLFLERFVRQDRQTFNRDFTDSRMLLLPLQQRTAFLIEAAAMMYVADKSVDKWNLCGVELQEAGDAFSLLLTATMFAESVEALVHISRSAREVLGDLLRMFCLFHVDRGAKELLQSGFFTPDDVAAVREEMKKTMAAIRVNAVRLVDAFDFSDHYLNSALGRYDGRVYEALIHWARQNPLNDSDFGPGVEEFLLPALRNAKL